MVDKAHIAALKNTEIFLLQNRHDEVKASTAARTIATSPPKSISARKIKVSETEICEVKRGIWIEIREPNPSVKATRTINWKLISLKRKVIKCHRKTYEADGEDGIHIFSSQRFCVHCGTLVLTGNQILYFEFRTGIVKSGFIRIGMGNEM